MAAECLPVYCQCTYCWHPRFPAVGDILGVRLCMEHLASAHDKFRLPIRLVRPEQIREWRARGYDVLDEKSRTDLG